MTKLEKIRKQLDSIDDNISKLLQKRAKLLIDVKNIKEKEGIKIKDSKREEFILGKMENNFEKQIFKKILSESRKLQSSKKAKASLQKPYKMGYNITS
ncbi:chorismate mutase [Candidatus Gracilibacteria bacterium]|nr:chorismate mutase [Candidatus Gracilibacteria bacterium]